MPTRPPKQKPTAPAIEEESVIISSFRAPRPIVDKFDAWVAEQNVGRRGPKLSRVDVIRALMDWASDTKPDWESK